MIKLLVKNRLRSFLGSIVGRGKSGTVKKASAGKIVGLTLLYIYVIGCFLFLSASMSLALGAFLIPAGASWLYFAVFMLASLSIVFIFSIFETKSELFECKDNDLLLSMPIKPKDIVLSRISVVLIYNYIEELIIMLPCIAVYAVFSHGDIVGMLGALVVSLLIPLLATALASAVGYAVALISKKLKKNSFVTLAFSIIFLLLYIFGYSELVGNMDSFLEGSYSVSPSDLPLLYAIGSAATFAPLSILVLAVLSVGSALLAYYIISKSYIKLVTDNRGEKRAVYKDEKLKSKSALYALTNKELKRFFSSATYMLNTGIGLVFEIILAIFAVIKRNDISETIGFILEDMPMLSTADIIPPIMIAAIVFISSMNVMSACALSLEGKNLWIPKTMPIRDRDVMLSKVLPHIIVTAPPTLISSIMLIIASDAHIKYWIFFILTPIAANIFSAFLGLVINVAFPKFEYDNEAQPIKQSLSVFLVMIIQMLLGVAIAIITFVMTILSFGFLTSCVMLLLFCMLSVLFGFILLGPSARRYAKIEI